MANVKKEKMTQRILDEMNGKNLIISSIITKANGKATKRNVTLSPSVQAQFRALAKKDANSFNKAVTQQITAKIALDSYAEKKGDCANAHPKMIQARVARLLGVHTIANLVKTNSYLRVSTTKKTEKKKTVKK